MNPGKFLQKILNQHIGLDPFQVRGK